jgi:hypothetical protein
MTERIEFISVLARTRKTWDGVARTIVKEDFTTAVQRWKE